MTRAGLRMTEVATPLGILTIVASERGVVSTSFDDEDADESIQQLEERLGLVARRATTHLAPVAREVEGYFAGNVRAFSTPADLSLVPEGFGRRVLEVTATIAFGELWTYGDVAELAGTPRGGRAAGNALKRCPIELFVPCHRVVHAGGSLGGYGKFTDRKRWLVVHEASV